MGIVAIKRNTAKMPNMKRMRLRRSGSLNICSILFIVIHSKLTTQLTVQKNNLKCKYQSVKFWCTPLAYILYFYIVILHFDFSILHFYRSSRFLNLLFCQNRHLTSFYGETLCNDACGKNFDMGAQNAFFGKNTFFCKRLRGHSFSLPKYTLSQRHIKNGGTNAKRGKTISAFFRNFLKSVAQLRANSMTRAGALTLGATARKRAAFAATTHTLY